MRVEISGNRTLSSTSLTSVFCRGGDQILTILQCSLIVIAGSNSFVDRVPFKTLKSCVEL